MSSYYEEISELGSLVGNLGRSLDLLIPAGSPQSQQETLAQGKIVGGDGYSPSITVTIFPLVDNANARGKFAVVHFGSDGTQAQSITIDIKKGVSFAVPGSWVRVDSYITGNVGVQVTMGAFLNLNPITQKAFLTSTSETLNTVAGASFGVFTLPFAQKIMVRSSDNRVDDLFVEVGNAATARYMGMRVPPGGILDWQPITGDDEIIRITNIGALAVGVIHVIQGIEL
jgi:hypothetical protein